MPGSHHASNSLGADQQSISGGGRADRVIEIGGLLIIKVYIKTGSGRLIGLKIVSTMVRKGYLESTGHITRETILHIQKIRDTTLLSYRLPLRWSRLS